MAKARYQKHPRAIIQARSDHATTLTVTIPKKVIEKTGWKAGDIMEFIYASEGFEPYVKVRKVQTG